MTKRRDIKADIKKTNELILSKESVIPQAESWLGHTKKGGKLDYALLKGGTIEELANISGRAESAIIPHIRDLKNKFHLNVSNNKGYYKFELQLDHNDELYKLKNQFLQEWPIERLKQMKLEEYTNLDKETSFCYWLEARTTSLGSIWGGSAYKFGIYKRKDKSPQKIANHVKSDGEYAWSTKYGVTKEAAFETVKSLIIDIAVSAQNQDLSNIESIDLGFAYKWKIAFLYSDYKVLNAFKEDAIRVIASNLNIKYKKSTPISQLHNDILKLKPSEKDYFTWTAELWKQYQSRQIDVKKDFAKWLNANTFESYRAYLGFSNKDIEKKLDEINSFFDDVDFFLVDPNNINGLVNTILFLLSKKERIKNPDFVEYDSKNSNGIPKAILGKNNYIKFLREKFDYKQPNYWIFQGNPNVFDFKTALEQNILNDWTVTAHKNNIKAGDKIIIWITGSEAGCYALGEITKAPEMKKESSDDHLWKTKPKNELKVGIRVTHNLVNNPVTHKQVKSTEALQNLKVGNQGTNFSSTEEEFNTVKNLINDDNNAMKQETEQLFDLYYNYLLETRDGEIKPSTMEGYVETASSKIPERWEETYHDSFNNFEINFENLKKIVPLLHKNFSGITSFIPFINTLIMEYRVYIAPVNQILYGPPGTGKTFYLKDQLFDKYILKETLISPEKNFEETVSNLTWWQVIALSLLEIGTARVNDILENRWVATKASLSESKNVRATLWGTLQMHTIIESKSVAYTQRQAPYIFDKNADKSWSLLDVELNEQAPELLTILDDVNYFKASDDNVIKHYDFVTFHQSFAYEDFIEGIKPILPENGEETTDLGYAIEDGVFKKLCLRAKNDPDNRYAIFIDEINRGNVSAIFGELITLIEIDKRTGAKNELSIKLPYSKKEFSVPSNLDIYGTMNTADRSVEALDTALRRRFEFKEMMPNYDVITNEKVEGISLSEVLKRINQRIELLIDRDHTIGHSYFVGVNTAEKLANAFNNRIVPLLQEYFYGDYGKIGLVLGDGFVEINKNDNVNFTSFAYENANDFKTICYTLTPVNSSSILDAIKKLLNKKESTI